jgi:hypothetical protein
VYKSGDEEAFQFAVKITEALRRAGWMIDEEPQPITKDPTIDDVVGYAPKMRPGITITAGAGQPYLDIRLKALSDGFAASGFANSAITMSGTSHDGSRLQFPSPPRWDSSKSEMVMARAPVGAKFTMNYDYSFFIAFGDIELIDSQPVLAVLNEFVNVVQGVVVDIETETKRLGLC